MTQQRRRPIDPHAIRIPQASGLSPCLYVPIAARDPTALNTYVGAIVGDLSSRALGQAFLVESYEPDPPDERLAIWKHPAVSVLHRSRQVWVHVDYSAYRKAYVRAFPEFHLGARVLDHVMNRRVARLKGFSLLRIVPISRDANSSHGGLSEDWGFQYHSTLRMTEQHRASQASIQYADLSDIVKMLDLQGGGSFMETVNDAQRLVDIPNG